MGRYIQEIKLNQPIDVVSMIMEDYVYHHRFKRNDWNGEMVYYMKDKHGKERYMKYDYTNGVFHLEAWLKNAFGSEEALNGFGSTASKNEFRKSLDLLVRTLKTQKASAVSSGHVGSDPLHHTDNHAAEHRAQNRGQQMSFGTMPGNSQSANRTQSPNSAYRPSTMQKRGNVNDASNVVFAVLALIFSSIPVVGLILAIRCIKRCKGRESSNAKLIYILCVLAIIMSVMSLFTGLLPMMMLPVMDFF